LADVLKDLDEETLSTAKAILDYLKDNPDAKDNLDGIAKWWVQKDPILVKGALDFLRIETKVIFYDSNKKLYSIIS
jgi:hypothetical protein